MPATFQAALILALFIAPGYVLIQGYRQGRTYSPPDKDLYVLAQAVVASLGWLAVAGLVLSLFGDPMRNWGLMPQNTRLLEQHVRAVTLLVLAIEFAPFALGVATGSVVNALQGVQRAHALLNWTGIFEPPTAWEQAWSKAAARAKSTSDKEPIAVRVHLKGGEIVEGLYGGDSRADLSPRPGHHLYLETAYGLEVGEAMAAKPEDGTIGGVFIDGSEIATIYFKS